MVGINCLWRISQNLEVMGNYVYMLAHAGFTKKQIVYNIDAPFDAAQEEYKEKKKKEKSNDKPGSWLL